MKKVLTTVLLLAALTALILAGCGNNNAQESDLPEELNTFGVTVNPSAVPSTGEMQPETSTGPAIATTQKPGKVDNERNVQSSSAPASPSPTKNNTSNYVPPTTYTPTAQPSPSPSEPLQSPPADPSGCSAEDARKYIGKSLSSLISELGYPVSSDYEPIDEDDPSAGDIGTLTFAGGFTVTTKRNSEGETITAVNE